MKPTPLFTGTFLTGFLLLTACTSSSDAMTDRIVQGMDAAQRAADSAHVAASKDKLTTGGVHR